MAISYDVTDRKRNSTKTMKIGFDCLDTIRIEINSNYENDPNPIRSFLISSKDLFKIIENLK